MLIGVPKETKVREYRVGLVPASVAQLSAQGHLVLIETNAGAGIGATDEDYRAAGGVIVDTPREIFDRAELIVKVKEPQPQERSWLKPGQILFTYLHLAPDPEQTRDLVRSGATCIAYETVTSDAGGLPLLAPMSQVAGRLAIQAGAHFLEKTHGGEGILLGGVPGVAPARVVVIGGGMVGRHAVEVALGMGAHVTLLDRNPDRLRNMCDRFGPGLETAVSAPDNILKQCLQADLIVGAVLLPGATAPKLLSRDLVSRMKPGSVIVDVAIDQGGVAETSRPTTHDDPVFVVDGVMHYCVANMPGAVPRTSAYALNNATQPFVMALAASGLQAMRNDRHLRNGLNVHAGKVTCEAVASALGYEYRDAEQALEAR